MSSIRDEEISDALSRGDLEHVTSLLAEQDNLFANLETKMAIQDLEDVLFADLRRLEGQQLENPLYLLLTKVIKLSSQLKELQVAQDMMERLEKAQLQRRNREVMRRSRARFDEALNISLFDHVIQFLDYLSQEHPTISKIGLLQNEFRAAEDIIVANSIMSLAEWTNHYEIAEFIQNKCQAIRILRVSTQDRITVPSESIQLAIEMHQKSLDFIDQLIKQDESYFK